MQLWVRRVVAFASLMAFTTFSAGVLAAQGVASSAISGTVTQDGGRPVEGAQVIVVNTLTGQRFQVATRGTGRYTFENLPPGGPYTIEVRAIGFQSGRRTGVQLALGQRFSGDFTLRAQVVEVQELVVQGQEDPIINRGRTGASSTVSDSAVSNLPSIGRSFTDLITVSPAVAAGPGGRPSIAGSNNRFNNIQVDGAVNNDLFGLGSTGAPGGQTQGRAIPLDAVKEFQVLVAPFDVRQGGFTGGLVNAVTRAGDNQYRGSVFFFNQNDNTVTSTPEPASTAFSIKQFGGSFSGPIVRDRAHFFVSYDQQVSTTPYSGVIIGEDFDTAGGIGATRCSQFAAILDSLGYDPGSCGGFDFDNPNVNFFGKVTAQAGATGQVEFTLNYANSEELTMVRASNAEYWLTGGGYRIRNTNLSPRFKWTDVFGGRFNNEFLVGYSRIRDPRTPERDYTPVFVNVAGSTGNYTLVSGAEINSHKTGTNQDVFELTDNLTFDVGRHRILLGTHNEFFEFQNDFYSRFRGQWTFSSLANFQAGIASEYQRNVPAAVANVPGGRADGPTGAFGARQFGLYAQDQWTPTPNLTLTVGLRMDVPVFPLTPSTNPRLLTALGAHYNTGEFPSGNILWSPRLGFNYDLGGTGDLIVRGGVGVFSGRPAYVWLANAYQNTGLEQANLRCTGAAVPNFNTYHLDPDNQPTTCATGASPAASAADVNMFDPDFKFPQSVRLSLGVDKRLPMGWVASIDGMYSNQFKALNLIDYNLVGTSGIWPDTGLGVIAAEGNRIRYGNVTGASPSASRVSSSFRSVIYHLNRGRDYSYSGMFQLQRRFADNYELNLAYTYARSYDLMSNNNSTSSSNYGRVPLDGSLTDRNLRPSSFDRPHKVSVSGLVHLPYNFAVSLQYVGISGTPYAYVVQGDANADGVGSSSNPGSAQNDLFYVPKDVNDITIQNAGNTLTPTEVADRWTALDAYINQDPCLKDQRGKIMERNSCRNPWQTYLNMNVSWTVETYRGQRLELSAGIFNLLHFLNEDWGLVKETSQFEGQNIVVRTGWDATNLRNRYDLTIPKFEQVSRFASRGRVLLGARYTF